MRRLHVDLEEIAMAMETQMSENESYLDAETGELVVFPYELRGEDVFDDGYVGGLPEWEQDLVPQAREILQGSDRYAAIPTAPSYEEYDLMVEFAGSVSDPRLRDLLAVALDGRGAFGRFKRILEDTRRRGSAGFGCGTSSPRSVSGSGFGNWTSTRSTARAPLDAWREHSPYNRLKRGCGSPWADAECGCSAPSCGPTTQPLTKLV